MIASMEAPYPDVQQLNFDGTPFIPEAAPQQEIPRQSLIARLGDMATRAVITAQIKAEAAIEAATDFVKQKGAQVIVRGALAGLAVAAGAGLIGRESTDADAAAGPQYTVAGTAAGGVYSRNTPHTGDTPRIAGRGAYPGDVLTLECGVTDGDPVPPYNNHTWYYAHDNSRPEPDFWVNDHYMNTPNAANQLAPGVPTCPNESSNPMEKNGSSQPIRPRTSNYAISCKDDDGYVALETLDFAVEQYQEGTDENLLTLMKKIDDSSDVPEVVCVDAQLSKPDTQNHRQYVGTVEASAPEQGDGTENCGSGDYLLEIWGDGFYKKTDCTNPTAWQINKWLRAGTYVCAAISSQYDYKQSDALSPFAGDVIVGGPLGEADPHRVVTCFQIKA